MKHVKAKIFVFLLWYTVFFMSATGDKYFTLPSCMVINWIGMSYPSFVAFLLVVIPAVYFSSFAFLRLHKYICILLFVDGFFGFGLGLGIRGANFYGWEDSEGLCAYFWKPFFDTFGLNLQENALFNWSFSASIFVPLWLYSTYAAFPETPNEADSSNDGKKPPFKQQLRDAWKKHRAILPGLLAVVFVIYFFFGPSCKHDNWLAEQKKQEFRHHLEAAESGNVSAMVRVGAIYWRGTGTEFNTAEALRWFEKGAQNGSAEAMLWLGRIYYTGYRTGRDWGKARHWLNAAIETDPENAKKARDILSRIDKGLLPHQR